MAFALRLIAPMVLGLLPQDPPTAPPTFTCSPGPFERTWALVDATLTPRAPSSLPLGELDRPAIWSTWAVQLRAATTGTPAERAQGRLWVAAFAAAQGRSDDAWSHLAAAGEDPAGLLAVLPMLAPGVAAADLAAWPRLPSGALLTPALPPPAVDLDEILLGNGRVRPGEVSVREFRVGDARLCAGFVPEVGRGERRGSPRPCRPQPL